MKCDRKKKAKITRRGFLKSSAAAGVALTLPAIVPASVFGANAPSNRIVMGSIGVGKQGTRNNLRGFLGQKGVQVVAVCDVDANHLKTAADIVNEKYANSDCAGYNDFRQLLAREDIDAVVISTPDHWHVPISVAAAKAGKDIYCEKPLTLTIAGGRALCDAVTRYGTVLQTGSQQRSASEFRFACELVRNGRIGKLHTVRVGIPGSMKSPLNWSPEPVPSHFDYDFWLGPAPWAPYTDNRCHYTFRFILDYSGGQMTNWGAHHLDIAQWGIGSEKSGPVEIVGRGEFPKDGLFNTATKCHIEYTYANGVRLICEMGGKRGTTFEGTDGWVYVRRRVLNAEPVSLLTEHIGSDEIRLYESRDHKQNFLDCVRLRKEPVANAEIGHRSSTVCHLGNIAMLLGRKLKWDPGRERFVNDTGADSMLSRSARGPWTLL